MRSISPSFPRHCRPQAAVSQRGKTDSPAGELAGVYTIYAAGGLATKLIHRRGELAGLPDSCGRRTVHAKLPVRTGEGGSQGSTRFMRQADWPQN
ncbi:MAG: hypothetical protein R3C56_11175 [Pirellulaceae bacterium]